LQHISTISKQSSLLVF